MVFRTHMVFRFYGVKVSGMSRFDSVFRFHGCLGFMVLKFLCV